MPVLDERVDTLETILARFIENTDRAIAEMHADVAEIRASNARTDAMLLKMQQQADKDRAQAGEDRQQAERERKDFNRQLAAGSDSMGTLIEDMVAPNIKNIAAQLFPDDPLITIAQRVKRQHARERGRNMEVDLLAAGSQHVLVCEAKMRVSAEKIAEFLARLKEFGEFFPEYASLSLVPVLASVNIDPSAIVYLNRQKVYGLAFGGETMDLVNAGQF